MNHSPAMNQNFLTDVTQLIEPVNNRMSFIQRGLKDESDIWEHHSSTVS